MERGVATTAADAELEPDVTQRIGGPPQVVRVGPDRYRCEVVVPNELGFHVRPATDFVRLALNYESDVAIHLGSQQVDGKSAVDILTLAAEQGSLLILEAHGPDAESALVALARLVSGGFDEQRIDSARPVRF
jgi:phosphotransferase system HPr (HPr) family protein